MLGKWEVSVSEPESVQADTFYTLLRAGPRPEPGTPRNPLVPYSSPAS